MFRAARFLSTVSPFAHCQLHGREYFSGRQVFDIQAHPHLAGGKSLDRERALAGQAALIVAHADAHRQFVILDPTDTFGPEISFLDVEQRTGAARNATVESGSGILVHAAAA